MSQRYYYDDKDTKANVGRAFMKMTTPTSNRFTRRWRCVGHAGCDGFTWGSEKKWKEHVRDKRGITRFIKIVAGKK